MIQGEQQDNEPTNEANEEHEQQEENNNNEDASEPEPAETENELTENQETNDESEIKGIVHGEPDNNVVQSASRLNAMDDEDNKVCIPISISFS